MISTDFSHGLLPFRLRLLLRNKRWDTRVAAAHAIEAVCRAMEPWEPLSTDDGDTEVWVHISVFNEGGREGEPKGRSRRCLICSVLLLHQCLP